MNKYESWWTFSTDWLPSGLFFSHLLRVGKSDDKEVQRQHEQNWHLGTGCRPLLFSEKRCKFL